MRAGAMTGENRTPIAAKRLRDNLLVFPGSPNDETVFVQDTETLDLYKFEKRELLLLEALKTPVPEAVLVARYNARFDADFSVADLRTFLTRLDDMGLLAGAGEQIRATGNDRAEPHEGPQPSPLPQASPPTPDDHPETGDEAQTVGRRDKIRYRNHWSFFCPEPLLDGMLRWFGFVRHLVVVVPFVFLVAVAGFVFNWDLAKSDLRLISIHTHLLEHVFFSLFTTNLATQLTKGSVARYFGLPVPSFGLTFILGILPRFNVRIETSERTDRRAQLWVFGTPILVRLSLFPAGLILWLATRGQGTLLPLFGLALAFLTMISFLFVANPLMGNAGYQWLSTYFNNPRLREKAFRALRYRFRKPPGVVVRYVEDTWQLRWYAAASILFMVGLVAFVTMTLAQWLEFHYGGLGVTVSAVLGAYLFLHLHRRLAPGRGRRVQPPAVGQTGSGPSPAMARGRPTREWTSRPTEGDGEKGSAVRGVRWGRLKSWRRYALWGTLAVSLFLPYQYEAGGPARIGPLQTQEIYAQYPGVVERVYYDGGEWVERGTVIADMTSVKQRRDIDVTAAQIENKQEKIQVLVSTPLPEQVTLAEEKLRTAEVRLKYSIEAVDRIRKIYEKQASSYVTYEKALEEMETARQEVVEQRANLEAVKNQVNPHDIEALRAELEMLQRDLAYFEEVRERTVLRMPFDGRITTMHLQNLQNKYLENGKLFATVEDSSRVEVEVDIPESDMNVVALGDTMRLKLLFLPNRTLYGEITTIYPTSTETDSGNVVTVVGLIDNSESLIKSGMTGYAKVDGKKMYAIQAFTRALVRFFQVEVWSWLP